MKHPLSLRLQLLISLTALFLMAWTILGVWDLYNSRIVVASLLDDHLAQTGKVLIGITLHEMGEESNDGSKQLEEILSFESYNENLAFAIWQRESLLMASANAPPFNFKGVAGYADVVFQEPWRVLTLRDPHSEVIVCVGMPEQIIAEQLLENVLQLLLPLLVTLPLMVLSIWFGVKKGLGPLHRVAAEIATRSPRQLDPVEVAATPTEILPLIHSLNQLLSRLGSALEAERRFTSHAAHELRTPLASLKVQAQVALRSSDDASRQKALYNVLASADRSTHLVQQLLTLARMDPYLAHPQWQSFSPGRTMQEVLCEASLQSVEKGIELELADHLPEGWTISGVDSAFAVMVRNLVENALRYTPTGGRVQVSLTARQAGLNLLVDDSGPGIPPADRQAMFERFRRGTVQDTLGCGLGLSIVAAVVEIHRGKIILQESPLGGLRAEVCLPGEG